MRVINFGFNENLGAIVEYSKTMNKRIICANMERLEEVKKYIEAVGFSEVVPEPMTIRSYIHLKNNGKFKDESVLVDRLNDCLFELIGETYLATTCDTLLFL